MTQPSKVQQNLVPNELELIDLLNQHKKQTLLNFFSHHIGTIQSFNSELQTAVVTINYKKTFFEPDSKGNYVAVLKSYPTLTDCPVICLGGGGGALTFPIERGNECLVIFNDRDFDVWWSSGNVGAAVATPRLHSFSDAIVIVGVRSKPNSLTEYDEENVALRNGEDGSTNVSVGETLITIQNQVTTLNTQLQALISAIQSLSVTVSGVELGGGTALGSILPSVSLSDVASKLGQLLG